MKAEDAAEFHSSIFGWKVRERGDGNLACDDSGSGRQVALARLRVARRLRVMGERRSTPI
jgi:hypothetical protein